MRKKRIANHITFQKIVNVNVGIKNVNINIIKEGYTKERIYKGLYKDFARDEMHKYENCKVTELRADENVLYIGIEG